MISSVVQLNLKRALYLLIAFSVSLALPKHEALANDMQVTNVATLPESGGFGEVEFDISWQNSWRTSSGAANYDAAWVFAKLSRNGGDWQHLNLTATGHTIPAGVSTELGMPDTASVHNASSNPAVGIFLFRSADGTGTFTANDVRLRWNYADNGALAGDTIVIRVFALEMVYVPQGAFSAGDTTSTSSLRQTSVAGSAPWSITSEGAITTEAAGPNWYYSGGGDAAGSVFTIPAAFPKGFAAMYMMKGEISQSQWVAFFNTLTTGQKSTRDITSASGKNTDNLSSRNSVSWTSGDATLPDRGAGATYTGVGMGWISWADVTAYLDWSGLRPMSELEYEKAGRGPNAAVAGEYAWGSTSLTNATSVTDLGLISERGQAGSNASVSGGVSGPMRVGSFAKGVTTRVASGAGFYGVMELTGNLWERPVTVGNATGRAFEGRYHGNGTLDSSGNPNVTTWPGTAATGSGLCGGGWNDIAFYARLSDRWQAANTTTARNRNNGGRGVRSAP
jgi:hypothetical protein